MAMPALNDRLSWSIMFYGPTFVGAAYDPVEMVLVILHYDGSTVTLLNQGYNVTNAIQQSPDPEAYCYQLISQAHPQ
jgi:hypothetical protein